MSDLLNLQKTFELNLEKAGFPNIPIMATKLSVDRSGSMDGEFQNGFVDHLIKRFFVAAMKFDDDGVLEVGAFHEDFDWFPEVKEEPVNYTRKVGMFANGGTCFAPTIKEMASSKPSLFGRLRGQKDNLAYIGFLTDGENQDRHDFERALQNTDPTRNFVQMIGIGAGVNTHYLKSLSDEFTFLEFIHFPNPMAVTDDQFYQAICNPKFKAWIESIS